MNKNMNIKLTFSIAELNFPVIRLQTLAAKPVEAKGSSLITVFKPILEMSLNCSLSDTMLLHRESTIVSTWYSFTLLTNGPKLQKIMNVDLIFQIH